MHEIGSYEARVHFSEILRRVERGEEFTVTMRGRPVARIVNAVQADLAGSTYDLLAILDEFRSRVSARGLLLGKGESLKDMAREGAKW